MLRLAYCGSWACNLTEWKKLYPRKTMHSGNQTYKKFVKPVAPRTEYCPDCGSMLVWKLVKRKN